MRFPQLSGWHIATLVAGFSSAIALAAVGFVLGKEAVVALAVILLICVSVARWTIDF